MKRITLRISEDLASDLDTYRGDVPMNTVLKRMIERAVNHPTISERIERDVRIMKKNRSQ